MGVHRRDRSVLVVFGYGASEADVAGTPQRSRRLEEEGVAGG